MSTASYLQVFRELARLSATEVVIIFLVSKPVVVMMAVGLVLVGSHQDDGPPCLPSSDDLRRLDP